MAVMTTTHIFSILGDESTKDIFDLIAKGYETDGLSVKSRLQLTRKQYYSKFSKLIEAGLVAKAKRRYYVTSLGKVCYHSSILIEAALSIHWKLKAVDNIKSIDKVMPHEEKTQLLNMLIDNTEIRNLLCTATNC
jgi:hypothetical protein